MKTLDLREYAMNLYNRGDSAEMELAKEILDLIIFEENSLQDEMCEELDKYVKDMPERNRAMRQIEWLGDRSNLLADIEATLEMHGHKPTGTDDACEMVAYLCTEYAALKPSFDVTKLEFDL